MMRAPDKPISRTLTRDVAIIGAGSIARAHVNALARRSDVRISAIVDPSASAAAALSASLGVDPVYASIGDLLSEGKPDVAHVLTPPFAHADAATPLLEAGVNVLVEKPMAATADECRAMIAAATRGGAGLAVNHNFVHHPVFARARKIIGAGRLGQARKVTMRYAAPLRQLAARQFGHWMFNSPTNLLLEQAVHPLSLIDEMLGGIKSVSATPGPVRKPADGIQLVTDWMLSLECAGGTAQLEITLGASFPSWTFSVLCDDGVVDADMFEGRVTRRRAHNAIAPLDFAMRNIGQGFSSLRDGLEGVAAFVGELSRLGPPADGFSRSMIGSVNAFHDALARDEKPAGEQGLRLVELCEKAAMAVSATALKATPTPKSDAQYDVAVFGGTGFIGRHLVRRLVADNKSVAVIARNIANLSNDFHHERVGVYGGSISDEAFVADICKRASAVVNLAHGGGGATREAVVENMTGGAEVVARAASAAGVGRLIHVSSSAALYLGDADDVITSETPPDPLGEQRADYACAKIETEAAVKAAASIPLTIMRPAIVVGEGGSPFHSALGAYENETHCQGWNDGKNALPFVLADDVADAIVLALAAPIGDIAGKAFNLVGDIRWNARRYSKELADATGRPLKFHPMSVYRLYADECLKFAVKKVAGRNSVAAPSLRDLKSRGMVSPIDNSAEKKILGWRPCADDAEFRRRAIETHCERRS